MSSIEVIVLTSKCDTHTHIHTRGGGSGGGAGAGGHVPLIVSVGGDAPPEIRRGEKTVD